MIERIERIRNVGKFMDCISPPDADFAPVTLIYGGNGRGKTTLASILRSLGTGNPACVSERKTLGNVHPPFVSIRWLEDGDGSAADVQFRDGAWNAARPGLEVFDDAFVHQNVHAGETVENDQRKSLYLSAIGAAGVELAEIVDEIGRRSRALASRLQNLQAEISRHKDGETTVDGFCRMKPLENVEAWIQRQEKQIESLRQADAVLRCPPLSPIPVPALWLERIEGLLASSPEDLDPQAERIVREHVAHALDRSGENWISLGMNFQRGGACPFCGQDASRSPLLQSYRAYYSTSYKAHKKKIAISAGWIEGKLGAPLLADFMRRAEGNKSLFEFWRGHTSIDYPGIDAERMQKAWEALRATLKEHMDRKHASPLEIIKPGEAMVSAISDFANLCREIEETNRKIEEINSEIARSKAQLQRVNLEAANRELQRLLVARKRFTPEVEALCSEYQRLSGEKKRLEEEKEEHRKNLRLHTSRELYYYQESINEILARIGADFKIVEAKETMLGGTASMNYKLLIREIAVDLKASQSSPGFRSTMSGGDRAALAFAFFMARISRSASPERKVVVLDDPAVHMDSERQAEVALRIAELAKTCRQTVVLSHDAHFLRYVRERVPRERTKTLRIECPGHSSEIVAGELPI